MSGCRDYVCDLLPNVHEGLAEPAGVTDMALVSGDYVYYHYGCDGFDDRGWGCGYRTLMTLCSWVRGQLTKARGTVASLAPVPSNLQVQETLVDIGDKEKDFTGSKQWIGSVEACMALERLYGVSSKILHVNAGTEIVDKVDILMEHFRSVGSPLMMGGDSDNSSKGIMGICRTQETAYLLVVDPHFWGEARDRRDLHEAQWVKWQSLSDFHSESFYNLCLPQLIAVSLQETSQVQN